MHPIYDTAMFLMQALGKGLQLCGGKKKWMRCLSGLSSAAQNWQQIPEADHTVWVHCASLGELGVVRPVIKALKEREGCRVAVTFFSPTGVDALKGKQMNDIDAVGFLPADTPRNAQKMIAALQPEKVIFSVSEYWPNLLQALRRADIPTYLIGALLTGKEPHFKWYGGLYRKSLCCYSSILVLDQHSQEFLAKAGYHRARLMGDPLFDNAETIAKKDYTNPIVEKFAQQGPLMVIGSLSDHNDLRLTAALANSHPGMHLLIVPHETDESWIKKIEASLEQPSLRYSRCTGETPFEGIQSLIIDYVGDLAKLYRYGRWAYVGGGFTPYLHSVIEASVYGLPAAFGPRIERKETPKEMIRLGIGTLVENEADLCRWAESLQDETQLADIRQKARRYTEQNLSATEKILSLIGGAESMTT